MRYITSINNPEIKAIIKLHDAKERKKTKKCIFQGWRTIETAINANLKLDQIYTIEENLDTALNLTNKNFVTIVTEKIIKKISTLVTPSNIIAVFYIPEVFTKSTKTDLTSGLVLAQVSNPGNMGTLIRTAAACNLKTIVIIEGADPWSPKVIQASAGTIALVSIFQLNWDNLIKLKRNLKLCALVVKNGISIKLIKPDNILLIIGSEAHGIPDNWLKYCDKLVTLPMPGKTESLNAAVAGSIATYLVFVNH